MARIGYQLAALDLFDNVDEPCIGARLDADFLALAHDKAVTSARYWLISIVAYWVSQDLVQTKAMSIGASFPRCARLVMTRMYGSH
ncbi:MAG: hypothetical protein JO358_04555 [Alphaproteobacteria bacterium]|nr:hypothetical protein [Alphaproteobacteria bacterium]